MSKLPASIQQDIETLLKQGVQQGYVVQEDILRVFVEPEEYIEELDNFYDKVIKTGLIFLNRWPKNGLKKK